MQPRHRNYILYKNATSEMANITKCMHVKIVLSSYHSYTPKLPHALKQTCHTRFVNNLYLTAKLKPGDSISFLIILRDLLRSSDVTGECRMYNLYVYISMMKSFIKVLI